MKEGLLEIGGCQLWCVENKEGPQRDVILLHGAKFSAATWQELGTLDVLSQAGYPVHALDMPGYGQSKPCPSRPVELLHEYIMREKFNAPILIGPSMGGSICLDYYFTWPDTVGGDGGARGAQDESTTKRSKARLRSEAENPLA